MNECRIDEQMLIYQIKTDKLNKNNANINFKLEEKVLN